MQRGGGGVAASDVGDARRPMTPWLTVAADERSTATLRRPGDGQQCCGWNDEDTTSATTANNPAKSRFFVISTAVM